MRRSDERAGYRHARLQEILLEEIRAWLRDEAADPALQAVRITSLSLSVDYRHARVHFSVCDPGPEDPTRRKEVETALSRATHPLRAQLAIDLDLKRTPDLRFVFDGFAVDPEVLP
ncbi:MAG: ribosome-binding factor A [Deltaproteobacteria bacterium]|nr:ribosome-binding factor A [Deltaproteobacteria bacterium]